MPASTMNQCRKVDGSLSGAAPIAPRTVPSTKAGHFSPIDGELQAEAAEEDRDHGNAEIDQLEVERQPLAHVVGAEADDEHAQRGGDQCRRRGVLQHGGQARVHPAQTFSISGLPSRPLGRKISTSTRMAKAATSLYSLEK